MLQTRVDAYLPNIESYGMVSIVRGVKRAIDADAKSHCVDSERL